MRRAQFALTLSVLLIGTLPSFGQGYLIPTDRSIPPLALTKHHVRTEITDQVAVTTVEQTFRNHTSRPLEATYLFPVPRGASVNKFSMWIDGKETSGELLDAKQAEKIYTDIVRRTLDPGLLEYVDHSLMRMRVFPVPPHGEQKVKLSYTAVNPQEGGVSEYTYPIKTDGKSTRMLEEVSFRVHLTSQHPLQTIYSPTHSITVRHRGDREADIEFDQRQSFQVKDFQLFYATSNKEIGLTPLLYRPISMDDGYFLLTLSPQIEAAKAVRIPRDLVLVLDTSGSMSETKMDQAKKALRFCLNNLDDADRFGIVSFSTTAQTFRDELAPAKGEFLERARKWIDDLRAGGGTAIQPALDQALGFRGKDSSRSFTVVFFTDGIPTVDETNPDKIVNHVMAKNTANTRIFTFGVGDDVNAAMLDRLAEATRAVSTYVRPAEDIEVKVSGLHAKISYPVMTNVKLTANQVTLKEIYPPQLPDLFRGQQMIVMGRYSGNGPSAIRLTGMVGGVEKEIVYELTFPNRTDDGKKFVEDLWARRKVGYLLDQIRVNGESGELVQEIVRLAKRYGIATPYTSYLVVPDGPMPVIRGGRVTVPPGTPIPYGSGGGGLGASAPPALGGGMGRGGSIGGFAGGLPGGAAGPGRVSDFAKREAEDKKGDVGESRKDVQGKLTDEELKKLPADQRNDAYAKALRAAKEQEAQNDLARQNYRNRNLGQNQQGKLGVDLAEASNQLRNQDKLVQTANRLVNGRNCIDVGGVWIDDKFEAKMTMVTVKAQSDAYFRILERQPKMRDVFLLGNYLVWVAPSGQALVIDQNDGKETLDDAAIDALFAVRK